VRCGVVALPVNARNALIVQQRAAGWPVQKIALEHNLSVARVSKIIQDHRKDVRIAELEADVARLTHALLGPLPTPVERHLGGAVDARRELYRLDA
jgi:hypothetical protein